MTRIPATHYVDEDERRYLINGRSLTSTEFDVAVENYLLTGNPFPTESEASA